MKACRACPYYREYKGERQWRCTQATQDCNNFRCLITNLYGAVQQLVDLLLKAGKPKGVEGDEWKQQ